jgi:integrase
MLGIVATAPDKLAGLRDRALLLVEFGGALRRSELVALDVADIEQSETGLLVTIRGSKTDQERAGATIAIARGDVACPAKALREWLDAAGIEAGRSSARSTRAARCEPRGLPIDPWPTSSRHMPNAPDSTPAHSQAIRCGRAFLRPRRGRGHQSSK